MSNKRVQTSIYAKMGLTIINTIIYLMFNIAFYGLVIFAFVKTSEVAYDFGYQVFGNVSMEQFPKHEVELIVKDKDNISRISKYLEEKKIIKNQYSFWIRTNLTVTPKSPILKGTYQLNDAMNYETIIGIITGQEEVLQE